jgi:hypothetical protein
MNAFMRGCAKPRAGARNDRFCNTGDFQTQGKINDNFPTEDSAKTQVGRILFEQKLLTCVFCRIARRFLFVNDCKCSQPHRCEIRSASGPLFSASEFFIAHALRNQIEHSEFRPHALANLVLILS